MIFRVAAVCAAFVLALPGIAQAASSTTIDHVGSATIIQQQDPASALVGVLVVLRAGLDRESLAQNGLAALVAQTILRTPVAGDSSAGKGSIPLEDAIAAKGGSVHFTVDSNSVRFYVESLPQSGGAIVGLFTRALSAPDFSAPTVNAARAALVTRIAAAQNQALEVGLQMLHSAAATDANTALPALGTATGLAQLIPSDVQSFYARFYRRGGAIVSAVGRIDELGPDTLTAVASALPSGSTLPISIHFAALNGSSRQLVVHRDIPAPWLIAQFAAPSPDSKDFGPMLVLTAFMQRTLSDVVSVPNVVSQNFASDAVGAVYDYNGHPASLSLFVNGGIGDPNRTFGTALSVVNVLTTTKLEGSIDDFKAMAYGDFAIGATSLESRAWLAAVFAQNGSSPDFIGRAMAAIDATTAADLQRVARAYLANPTIALVLPRQQSN